MSIEALALSLPVATTALIEALVERIGDDGRLALRLINAPDAIDRSVTARVAIPGYGASTGDRVLVSVGASGDWYVLGALRTTQQQTIQTRSGASASIDGDAIVVRDRQGVIAVQFDAATGEARLQSAQGDLVLAAPNGRVVLESGSDVALKAPRDVVVEAGRSVVQQVRGTEAQSTLRLSEHAASVEAQTLSVKTQVADVDAREATLLADALTTRAKQVLTVVGRWELKAKRLVERVQDAYRDAEGVVQTRAARVRTVVKETFQVSAERTHMVSRDDTKIDGKRVLLG